MAAPQIFFADLVRESCTATGVGPLALGGALPGHRPFVGTVPTATLFHYSIAGVSDPAQWETGTGRLLADGRLERVTVAASSAAGAPVDFAAGLKTVALTVGAGWYAGATMPPLVAEIGGLTAELAAKQPVSTSHATGTVVQSSDLVTVRRGAGWTNVPGSSFVAPDATGKVGIGTASPIHAFQVTSGAIFAAGNAASVSLYMATGMRHTGTGPFYFDINTGGGAAGGLILRDSNGYTTRLVLEPNGQLRPGTDNGQSLGSAAMRWSVVYAGTGAINTSDARDKRDLEPVPDAWLDAWGAVGWRRYRFVDGRRWHVGLVAQEVHAAFAAHGVDAFVIGLLCRDDIADEHGRADRWGLRYDECLALEAAWQRREIERLRAYLSKRRVRKAAAA